MAAENVVQTYRTGTIEVSVHRLKSVGEFEIQIRDGETEPLRASADQMSQLRELLAEAELYARYQQQLSRQWCPTCGEAADW